MERRPLWVVQANLGSSPDAAAVGAACRALGLPCLSIEVIPFSDEPPDVPADRPTLFYGSANLIRNVARAGRWRPGAFFDEATFRFSEYLRHYGRHLLNADARLTTMGAFSESGARPDELFFIRPDSDLKEFAGGLWAFADFRAWCRRLRPGGFSVGLSTMIAVAEPVGIAAEWRLFLVDGSVVAGSRYRAAGRLAVSPEVPHRVVEFAGRMAAIWSPAPAFVMDVAEADGRLRIVELNGFNSSGFYAADVRAIVRAVSDVAGRMYAAPGETQGPRLN